MCLGWSNLDDRQERNVYLRNRVHICSDARPYVCMGTWSSYLVNEIVYQMLRLKMRRALLPGGMVLRHRSSLPVYDERFRRTNGHGFAEAFLLKSN